MIFVRSAIGLSSRVLYGALAVSPIQVEQPLLNAKSTPLILESGDGEQREFRTRPGTTFTLQIDSRNGGSKQMVVLKEDMAPGDRIPTHRHPHADELIFVQSGTGRVTLGDKVQEVQSGAVVFIPRDTWIGMENVGKGQLTVTAVFSESGYEEYLRAISVLKGQPVTPLSMAEVDALRGKYSHYAIYQ
jgi:quercetin dioxygenase-like cupin family protein